VKDVLNSNEKEGTINEISLSLDLINVKDGNNFYVGVSKPRLFVLLFVSSNATLLELHTLLFLFFSKICVSKLGVWLI